MHSQCPNCLTVYRVSNDFGGRRAFCKICENDFFVSHSDAKSLVEFVETAEWKYLTRFIDSNGVRGHDTKTMELFIQAFEKRKWHEENRVDRERHGSSLTSREKIWEITERNINRQKDVVSMMDLSPKQFEDFIAEMFSQFGYRANATGKPADNGIDVTVMDRDGSLLAVAQCKKYAKENKVGSAQVREFAGSFAMTKARRGFIFTTGFYTKNAKETSKKFDWMEIYSGPEIVRMTETNTPPRGL